MFVKRLMSAALLLILAGVALATGGLFLLVISILVSLGGTYELLKVDNMHKTMPGCITYVSVIGFYLFLHMKGLDAVAPWIVFSVMAILAMYVFVYPKHHAKSIALCIMAIMYTGVLTSFLYQTRCMECGNWLVWLVLIAASGSDTFAYLTGICIGKHHFSELSPKKTIEGCVGGVVGAALLGLLYSLFVSEQVVEMFHMDIRVLFTMIGAIGAAVSQIGDLVASAVKRNYGIKDYSRLIPGHGGILDRFDSILYVAPVVYYLLVWCVS
nr:phosphatidate cytidylyltransferase [Eubacterium sp.]